MAIRIDKARLRRTKAAIEKALAAGHPPPGQCVQGAKVKSCFTVAAEDLGDLPMNIRNLARKGGALERARLGVDWSKWKKPAEKVEAPQDPVEVRRANDAAAAARAAQARAERDILAAEGLRRAVMGLAAEPMRPPSWPADKSEKGKHREVLLAMLTDVHMGETISRDEMGGRNAYNRTIAGARLARYFRKIVELGTTHWSGPPPACLYLWLGGDLISGEIHEELSKTNDLLAIPAVQEIVGHVVAGVDLLLQHFACDIRIVSTPGNHGRVTRKPEAKAFAVDSYDTLVAWAVELVFKTRRDHGDPLARRVSVSAPKSGDALINIQGWNVLLTHGDRIGSRGGQGMIGPAATIARGMQKLVMDYAADSQIVDVCCVGHFHTSLELEQGFANGCLSGPSEYSKSGRFRSKPATQWLLSFHAQHGVARRWPIQVGAPEEGSIYRGRA